jgi:hypothetical protein
VSIRPWDIDILLRIFLTPFGVGVKTLFSEVSPPVYSQHAQNVLTVLEPLRFGNTLSPIWLIFRQEQAKKSTKIGIAPRYAYSGIMAVIGTISAATAARAAHTESPQRQSPIGMIKMLAS